MNSESRRIVWRLRLLTTTGLLVVVATLSVVGIALWSVRTERATVVIELQRLASTSDQLRRLATQNRSELQSTLDGTTTHWDVAAAAANFQRSVHFGLDSHPDPALIQSLTELDTMASRLIVLADQVNDWRSKLPATDNDQQSSGTSGPDAPRRLAAQHCLRRDNLKVQSTTLFEEIDSANTNFIQSARSHALTLAGQIEQRLSDAWRRMLLFGGACSAVFVWLAFMISRGIYWQVNALELARTEADQGRQTTQKLMLEQQAAAAELAAVNEKLLETSHRAGMAEVATGVLHNVGNVLNSVNVSSSLVMENLKKSRLTHLARVVSLVRDHQADLGTFITSDPAGKQVPGFLAQLAEHLANEQSACLRELAELQKNIEHIKDIVSMQQAYAGTAGFMEPVDLREMAEDALRIHLAAMMRHDITIVKEYRDVPRVLADKHKVLQILVNLVSNAKHAMKESPTKTLTIRIDACDNRVRATIRDTGYGIAPENLTRIFAHGFTTKKDGHGFGLHSGALAAKEIGGSLQAQSDGPGRGAVFTLELPVMKSGALAA